MKKNREVSNEIICPACDGKGVQKMTQPTEPGRKIYPPTCKECLGKGHVKKPQTSSV